MYGGIGVDSSDERVGSEDCRVGGMDDSEDCKVVGSEDCMVGGIVGSDVCKIVGSEDCGIGDVGSSHMSRAQRANVEKRHMLDSLTLNMPSVFMH